MYQRIVSLAPSNTEILFSVGAGDNVVGVTRFCDYPPEAKTRTQVGGWVDVDYDLLKSLKPDLVLTSTFVQEKVADDCKNMGLNVVHLNPKTLDGVYDSIRKIGALVGREPEADSVIAKMKSEMDSIRQKTAGVEKKRVYAEEWHKPPYVCGNWIPELIDAAGGIGVGRSGEASFEVKTDDIQNFNPDFIVLTWCGFHERSQIELVKFREGWSNISAISKGNVFAVDDSFLNRPGPRITTGAEKLARIMHPNLF